jgi:DNA replication protein DnaC
MPTNSRSPSSWLAFKCHIALLIFACWHEQIGDPTIADGILDRLVRNAHRIEMRGESMRKKRNPPQDEKKE